MVRARQGVEPGAWLAAQRTADAVKAVRSAARLDARPLLLASQVTPALLLLQARSLSSGLLLHAWVRKQLRVQPLLPASQVMLSPPLLHWQRPSACLMVLALSCKASGRAVAADDTRRWRQCCSAASTPPHPSPFCQRQCLAWWRRVRSNLPYTTSVLASRVERPVSCGAALWRGRCKYWRGSRWALLLLHLFKVQGAAGLQSIRQCWGRC